MNTYKVEHGNEIQHHTPVVVFPADRPAALATGRLLGRRGIPVYGIDADPKEIGMVSRYIRPVLLPKQDESDENRLECLLNLGKQLSNAVLIPVSDDAVLLTSKYRQELQKHFVFVMSDHTTITSAVTKDGLHKIASQHGIPAPRIALAHSLEQVKTISGNLPYPVILKPVFSPSWLRDEIVSLLRDTFLSGPPKVAYCKDEQTLLDMYQKIAQYDSRMIIEEVIPGDDENLVYYCFYLNRQSQPLAGFAGIKKRVLPVGFGSATFVQSFIDPELEKLSLKFLSGINYRGFGGIEFKKDARDDQYKLIEFNARLGMWDSLSARCGVDILDIAYRDTIGLPVEPQKNYRENVLWIDFQRDARAFLLYRKRKGMRFSSWIKSYRGEKEWAIYSRDDWKPAWVSFWKLFSRPAMAIRNFLKVK